MDHGLWPGEATAFGRVRQDGGEVGQVRADIGFGHADIRVCRHWPLARCELVGYDSSMARSTFLLTFAWTIEF